MKKLLALFCLVGALSLAADNYRSAFNDCLYEGNLQSADSVLQVWSNAMPEDPDLFPARFNLLFNRAYNEILVLSPEATQMVDELTLSDSIGNEAAYMRSETIWNDSLLDRAFDEIDHGIAAFPNRIDFRLGKAAAASFAGKWSITNDAVSDLLDQDERNGGQWLGSENEPQSNIDTLLSKFVFEQLREIYNSDSLPALISALPLADKAAKRFTDNVKIINMAGGLYCGADNNDKALEYFDKALRIAPDDVVALLNKGCVHYLQGDTAKALEIYRRIESGNYDENSRKNATQLIAEISAPVQDMRQYYYFFRYLPQIAAQTKEPDEFLDVNLMNTLIPEYYKLRSPFANSDIKVDLDSELNVVVWTFPMPQDVPMCRYIAFVPDGNVGCKVYTLERSFEDRWVIGLMTAADAHNNFGDTSYPATAAAFIKILIKKQLL